MFAVPGWNVSAPLAKQVDHAGREGPEGKKSKKRKRRQQEQEQEQARIDDGNVGEYWDKMVAGEDKKSTEEPAAVPDAEAAEETPEKKKSKRKEGKKEKIKKKKKDDDEAGEADDDKANEPIAPEDNDSVQPASKRDKKKRKKDHTPDEPIPQEPPAPLPSSALIPEPKGLTPLQRSMRAKLTSARFRHLNESLYTKPSAESLDLFTENPEMFEDYHRGFAQQVEVWPENPVDGYVSTITKRGKLRPEKKGRNAPPPSSSALKPLPRNFKGHCTIADLGCGTASLSHRLQYSLRPLNLSLHSFDLSKPTGPTASLVTVADISSLPVPDGTVDVAIFCLALMGTNWLDFIDEAYRILRWRGELWISEIKSRFGRVTKSKVPINSIGSLNKSASNSKSKTKPKTKNSSAPEEGADLDSEDEAHLSHHVDGQTPNPHSGTDVTAFISVLRKHGFVLDAPPENPNSAVDLSNKMFVKMQFTKSAPPTRGKNVKKETEARGAAGNGPQIAPFGKGPMKPTLAMGIKGKKFGIVAADAEEGGDEEDGKVLKPCLYKIR